MTTSTRNILVWSVFFVGVAILGSLAFEVSKLYFFGLGAFVIVMRRIILSVQCSHCGCSINEEIPERGLLFRIGFRFKNCPACGKDLRMHEAE